MALPQTLDPAAPATGDSPGEGDDQIRNLKQLLIDVLGLPTTAVNRLLLNLQEGKQGAGNLIKNASMESWGAGTTSAPTGWTLAGAGASTARNGTNFSHGTYAADLVRAGTDTTLTQDCIAAAGGQTYLRESRTYSLTGRVRATVATRGRIGINDGVTTTYSSYHTGGSSFETLAVTKALSTSATKLEVTLSVDTGDTTAQFDGLMLTEGGAAIAAGPSFAGPEAGASQLEAIADAEATATNVATDLKVLTVNIGVGEGLLIRGSLRKASGAAATAALGIKVNGVQIVPNITVLPSADFVHQGMFDVTIWQQSASYLRSVQLRTNASQTGGTVSTGIVAALVDTDMPNATITSVTITGVTGSASVTMGVRDVVAYKLVTS